MLVLPMALTTLLAGELSFVVTPETPFVGQRTELRLELVLPSDEVAGGLAQLTQRELETPVEFLLEPGAVMLGPPEPARDLREGERSTTVVLDGELVQVRARGGPGTEEPLVLTLAWIWEPDRAGPVDLPSAVAQYALPAQADPLGFGPSSELRRLSARAAITRVRSLPEEGRPLSFTGSLVPAGLTWAEDPVREGDGWKVILAMDSVNPVVPPRWQAGVSWVVRAEELPGGQVAYGLQPSGPGAPAPLPLEWSWFDPASARYRTISLELNLPRDPAGPVPEGRAPALRRAFFPLGLAWILGLGLWILREVTARRFKAR